MNLEKTQTEIKNKEHYEAVKKRLQELGNWRWFNAFDVDEQALGMGYKSTISFDENYAAWGNCGYKTITLDDLYEVEKERVIKHKFVVENETGRACFYNPKEREHDTYEAAEKYISLQEAGTSWSIKKITTIAEE